MAYQGAYVHTKEDLRALVVGMARFLDKIEYDRKTIYSSSQVKAAALAIAKLEEIARHGPIEIFEECMQELDTYEDIDLSSPEYEGMDDPL
jgi:hypothetical protein